MGLKKNISIASYKNGLAPTYSNGDSKKFIEFLSEEAMQHRAVGHPYLLRLAQGDFPDPVAAVKDLCHQYWAYSNDFIRYLTALISQLEDRKHRDQIMHNLIEESGHVSPEDAKELAKIGIKLEWVQGISHPKLFLRFLDALGMDSSWRQKNPQCNEAFVWKETFFLVCSSGGPAQALGALGLGTENIVKFVYRHILKAINRYLKVSRKDRVFFDLHAALDDEHGKVLTNIACEYARFRRNRPSLHAGMLMALNLRAAFFDAMMIRAESMKGVHTVKRPKLTLIKNSGSSFVPNEAKSKGKNAA